MDPISLSVLLGLILKSAAGEAGKSAWKGLTEVARRAYGDDKRSAAALDKAKTVGGDGALDLAGYLTQRAATDSELATQLSNWIAQAQRGTTTDDAVVNTVGGQAHVEGGVVQARDIGTVNLGGPGRVDD